MKGDDAGLASAVSRRRLLKTAWAALMLGTPCFRFPAAAEAAEAVEELKVPDNVPTETFDF